MLNRTIITVEGQNIFDIALQYFGAIDKVLEIQQMNMSVIKSINQKIKSGTVLIIGPANNNKNADYFDKSKKVLATNGFTPMGIGQDVICVSTYIYYSPLNIIEEFTPSHKILLAALDYIASGIGHDKIGITTKIY